MQPTAFFYTFSTVINAGKRMCTDDQHNEKIQLLKDLIEGRPPLDDHVTLSSVKSWAIDYRERKHLYIWLPVAQTLSFEEYGSGLVPAQTWINVGMPTGIRIFCTSSTTLIDMMIRCTDEEIP